MDFKGNLADSVKVPRENYEEASQKYEYQPVENLSDTALRLRTVSDTSTPPTYQSISTGVNLESTVLNRGHGKSAMTMDHTTDEHTAHLEDTASLNEPISSVSHTPVSTPSLLPTQSAKEGKIPPVIQNRTIGWMVEILKLPMTIPVGLTNIFHNTPLRYGDTTVKPQPEIKGVGSGLAAGGKYFGIGLYDGLTGLVTQPVQCAKAEGPLGFFKGFGKGIGGCVCKPCAGACGLVAYPFEGLYRDLEKLSSSTQVQYVNNLRTTIARLEAKRESRAAARRGRAVNRSGPQRGIKKEI